MVACKVLHPGNPLSPRKTSMAGPPIHERSLFCLCRRERAGGPTLRVAQAQCDWLCENRPRAQHGLSATVWDLMLTVTQASHTQGSFKGPLTPRDQCRHKNPKPNCCKRLPVNLENGLDVMKGFLEEVSLPTWVGRHKQEENPGWREAGAGGKEAAMGCQVPHTWAR